MGAMNIAIIWDFIRLRRWKNFLSLFTNVESRALFVIFGALFLLGLVSVGVPHMYTLFIESLFFVSTSGFDYNVIGLEMVPSAVLVAVALIGGSALSCLLYTSPSPRDRTRSRMPSSA